MYDVIIIGSGVSGMAAALYCGRFMMKTLVIGDEPGGTLNLAGNVENYPGFKSIQGMELAQKIASHAMEYDVEVKNQKVEEIRKGKGIFEVKAGKESFRSRTIIFATGTRRRNLGIPGEEKFRGRGIHTCAICDGPFYRNKTVAVAGGSDSAAKEALVLSEFADRVYIIYRREKIRAEPLNLKRVEKKMREGRIEVITNANVREIRGDKFVKGVVLDRPHKGKKELLVDGLFVEIGHIPLSDMAKPLGIELNEKGEIIIDRKSQTNVPGVFAAGDVVNNGFKQAITGVGEAVVAAYSAYQYVSRQDID